MEQIAQILEPLFENLTGVRWRIEETEDHVVISLWKALGRSSNLHIAKKAKAFHVQVGAMPTSHFLVLNIGEVYCFTALWVASELRRQKL